LKNPLHFDLTLLAGNSYQIYSNLFKATWEIKEVETRP